MTKAEFVKTAKALRNYWNWEIKLEKVGINLESSTAAGLADVVLELLTNDIEDWGLDPHTGMNWIVVWCSAPHEQISFQRKNQWITLEDAGALYDFVEEMYGLEWPEKIESEVWLK